VLFEPAPPNAKVQVNTKQGDFSFALSELEYRHQRKFLDGSVDVQLATVPMRLTRISTEDDFPSAAVGPDGTVWVAYISFKHGNNTTDLFGREIKQCLR